MGLFRKKLEEYPCIIIDHCQNFKRTSLRRDGEFLKERMSEKQYAIVEGPIWIQEKKTRQQGFLLDEQKGCTIRVERNKEDFMKIRTDPILLGTVIGSRLVKEAFDIRIALGTLIIGCLASALVGGFIGLMF